MITKNKIIFVSIMLNLLMIFIIISIPNFLKPEIQTINNTEYLEIKPDMNSISCYNTNNDWILNNVKCSIWDNYLNYWYFSEKLKKESLMSILEYELRKNFNYRSTWWCIEPWIWSCYSTFSIWDNNKFNYIEDKNKYTISCYNNEQYPQSLYEENLVLLSWIEWCSIVDNEFWMYEKDYDKEDILNEFKEEINKYIINFKQTYNVE